MRSRLSGSGHGAGRAPAGVGFSGSGRVEKLSSGQRKHEARPGPINTDMKGSSKSGGDRGERGSGNKGAKDRVGKLLRDTYQRTVQEPVPPEFIDLLGKLG